MRRRTTRSTLRPRRRELSAASRKPRALLVADRELSRRQRGERLEVGPVQRVPAVTGGSLGGAGQKDAAAAARDEIDARAPDRDLVDAADGAEAEAARAAPLRAVVADRLLPVGAGDLGRVRVAGPLVGDEDLPEAGHLPD